MPEPKKEVSKDETNEVKQPETAAPIENAIPVKDLPIVSPAEWRKKNYNVRKLQLPGGDVFLVKDVELANMAMSGTLSLPLLEMFFKTEADKKDEGKTEAPEMIFKDLKGEEMVAMIELINKFIMQAVIEPKLTEDETGDENTIPVTEIDIDDKMFIMDSCTRGGAKKFAGFSKKG